MYVHTWVRILPFIWRKRTVSKLYYFEHIKATQWCTHVAICTLPAGEGGGGPPNRCSLVKLWQPRVGLCPRYYKRCMIPLQIYSGLQVHWATSKETTAIIFKLMNECFIDIVYSARWHKMSTCSFLCHLLIQYIYVWDTFSDGIIVEYCV